MTIDQPPFSPNEKVIWDSHFGYEIGYFKGKGVRYGTYLIDMETGVATGPCSHSETEIHKYSEELVTELNKRYGYK